MTRIVTMSWTLEPLVRHFQVDFLVQPCARLSRRPRLCAPRHLATMSSTPFSRPSLDACTARLRGSRRSVIAAAKWKPKGPPGAATSYQFTATHLHPRNAQHEPARLAEAQRNHIVGPCIPSQGDMKTYMKHCRVWFGTSQGRNHIRQCETSNAFVSLTCHRCDPWPRRQCQRRLSFVTCHF